MGPAPAVAIGLPVLLRLAHGRLVLRTDVAAADRQGAFGVDADEHAGAGDVGRIIGDGPIVEDGERRLDLSEPFVHLVRQLVGAVILLLQLGVFGQPAAKTGAALLSEDRAAKPTTRKDSKPETLLPAFPDFRAFRPRTCPHISASVVDCTPAPRLRTRSRIDSDAGASLTAAGVRRPSIRRLL
jgi:hypothetical protein